MDKNILIFTGNGKGKSTAAFGMALRAVGHNQKVLIIQFMKQDESVGELGSLRQLGISVIQTGLGFVPRPESPRFPEHRQAAQQGFALACEALKSGDYDLIVLDELCGAVARGLLEERLVTDALVSAPAPVNIVLTGRDASANMIALADTVSLITPVKHALEQGVPARKGVEF